MIICTVAVLIVLLVLYFAFLFHPLWTLLVLVLGCICLWVFKGTVMSYVVTNKNEGGDLESDDNYQKML